MMMYIPDRPNYGPNTKWGATFRRFMGSILETLRGNYPKAEQLGDIRRFRVTLLCGDRYEIEVYPRNCMVSVRTPGGRGVHTTEFDDILEPILMALGTANLTDSNTAFPNSELKQATKEEHGFSHRLNSP